jgi:hypothetical protein
MTARYYTDKDLTYIEEAYTNLISRRMKIQERCLTHSFGNDQAREFATHGFGRRLGTLVRCLHNTFGLLPPQSDAVPTSHETEDALIQIQAFIMNVFGCLDNLAWVWVLERNIPNAKKGTPLALDRHAIGLRAKNAAVRASLPDPFRKYLESIEGWFDYLEDYRDALAHRIPLYVPPYAVDPRNLQRYHELNDAITKSVIDGRLAETKLLREQQDALKFFRPFIVHSWSQSRPMALHLQMLSDFKTIEAIGGKLLDELAQPAP